MKRNDSRTRRPDLSSAEFAAYVSKSISTVNRWANMGHPAARFDKFSGEWRFVLSSAEDELRQVIVNVFVFNIYVA